MLLRHTSPWALCKYINYTSHCQTFFKAQHRYTTAFYVYTFPCVSL